MALCPGLPRWASTKRNIHVLTAIPIINHCLCASSIYCDPWHPPCSIYMPESNLCPSFLWSTSWSVSLHFTIHTLFHPIIVFFHSTCPCHRNLFCCSTEIISPYPGLSLNSLLGTLSFSLTPHIYLTILIWSATSFSFLTGQVSLPSNILPIYSGLGQAPSMLACIPSGLVWQRKTNK